MWSGTTVRNHIRTYGLPDEHVQHDPMPPVEEEEEEVKLPHRACVYPPEEVDMVAFAKDVVLLVVNHGIPWKSCELLLKCVNSHVRGRVVDKNLPATVYQLRKLTHCSPGNAKLLNVCPECDFVFVDGALVCDSCGLPPRTRVKRQMIVNDIGVTIQAMFAVPQLAEAFSYPSRRVRGDGDVWDGVVLRDVPVGTCSNQIILFCVLNVTINSIQ
jgi:hypothetical protein